MIASDVNVALGRSHDLVAFRGMFPVLVNANLDARQQFVVLGVVNSGVSVIVYDTDVPFDQSSQSFNCIGGLVAFLAIAAHSVHLSAFPAGPA